MNTQTLYHEPHKVSQSIFQSAHDARLTLTPLENCFWKETHRRWPKLHWRRYAPVTIKVHEQGETWYAPFLCVAKKLIVVIQDREEFPYRIYGQNRGVYERHGYTVLDFSEDFSVPWSQAVWNDAMARVAETLAGKVSA